VPDFLVRLVTEPGDVTRTLIVEVSGGRKSPGPTKVKAETARDTWCTAVNNDDPDARWGYVELTSMLDADHRLGEAIEALRADLPITGDPEHAASLR
jgi:type III restriction enzyme